MFYLYICVVFYRRKILLALLQIFDNKLDKIRLQKLLFLFSQKQEKPIYHFAPYKFGCYSYSANADLYVMFRQGLLEENETECKKVDQTDYLSQLTQSDYELMHTIKSDYGIMDKNDLIKHTYLQYPFYAIKSEIAKKLLSKNELKKVQASIPEQNDIVLFTIGYEGISLEEYLVRLLKNNVKMLVDVRNNPLSMKYGFSKSTLKKCCESMGILYEHIPDVGIPSEYRQKLHSQKDYDMLFEMYKAQVLTETISKQKYILNLLKTHRRIALTCFEADTCQCHRKPLAEAIEKLPEFNYTVKHI